MLISRMTLNIDNSNILPLTGKIPKNNFSKDKKADAAFFDSMKNQAAAKSAFQIKAEKKSLNESKSAKKKFFELLKMLDF